MLFMILKLLGGQSWAFSLPCAKTRTVYAAWRASSQEDIYAEKNEKDGLVTTCNTIEDGKVLIQELLGRYRMLTPRIYSAFRKS